MTFRGEIMSSNEAKTNSYKFEKYEEYYGDVQQVQKLINDCKECGAKLIQTHLSDYGNLFVQENSRCPECGQDNRKIIHSLN